MRRWPEWDKLWSSSYPRQPRQGTRRTPGSICPQQEQEGEGPGPWAAGSPCVSPPLAEQVLWPSLHKRTWPCLSPWAGEGALLLGHPRPCMVAGGPLLSPPQATEVGILVLFPAPGPCGLPKSSAPPALPLPSPCPSSVPAPSSLPCPTLSSVGTLSDSLHFPLEGPDPALPPEALSTCMQPRRAPARPCAALAPPQVSHTRRHTSGSATP